MPSNRPTLRDAAIARARYEGFVDAANLIDALAGTGIDPGAVAAAMKYQSLTLLSAAEEAEKAVRDKPAPRPKAEAAAD